MVGIRSRQQNHVSASIFAADDETCIVISVKGGNKIRSMNANSQNARTTPLKTPTGRSRRKTYRWAFLFLVLLAAAAAVDALLIEPYFIEVTHHELHGPVTAPLKIAHLSDIHAFGFGRREREMLRILEKEKPDIILITGDSPGRWLGRPNGDFEGATAVYEHLHAPLGVWFVHGNWENARPIRNERAFYQSVGVHLLLNSNGEARPDVWIAGLDDPYTGAAKPDAALAGIPPGAYTIMLFHSPGYFSHVAGRVNLCLAGHTHGGQVRLPFAKPFWLPRGSGHFLEGWYEDGGTKMYVSRGIGTSTLPIRFFCRPEIAFITVEP
jgi:predicted MPP superfamily phosphohydrolase